MKCEKCGAVISAVLINKFSRDGSDYEQIVPLEEPNGESAAFFITDQNWTGYELTEQEQRECIRCPVCHQFPFTAEEINVYDEVQVICFKQESEEINSGTTPVGQVQCKFCGNLELGWWCEAVNDSPDIELVRECEHFRKLTNFDRITKMSAEELGEFLKEIAASGKAPWDESFIKRFCESCPTEEATIIETGQKLKLRECDFSDGVCPHGDDVMWWLNQPVKEGEKCTSESCAATAAKPEE